MKGNGLLQAMHDELPDCGLQWQRGFISLEAVCEVLSVVQVQAHQPLQVWVQLVVDVHEA